MKRVLKLYFIALTIFLFAGCNLSNKPLNSSKEDSSNTSEDSNSNLSSNSNSISNQSKVDNSSSFTSEALKIFPGPGTINYKSNSYKVEINNGSNYVEAYTYFAEHEPRTMWYRGSKQPVNFITFSTAKRVKVKVTKLTGKISSLSISPLSKNVAKTISGATCEFEMSTNDKFWITFDNEETNPLLIFADSMPPPVPKGATYFGPGVHDIGNLYAPKNGETIYLDGGAWVKGNIDIRGKSNVTITGPGVLSGEKLVQYAKDQNGNDPLVETFNIPKNEAFQESLKYFMILGDYKVSKNNKVEHITIVSIPRFATFGGVTKFYSTKLISPWFWSSDGYYVMPDSSSMEGVVDNCFAFIGDNVFFPLDVSIGNLTYTNCFVGTTNNSVFCMSYWPRNIDHNYKALVKNIDIKDTTAINDRSIFQCFLDGHITNDVGKGTKNQNFEDIRIEGNLSGPLFVIENIPYPWGRSPDAAEVGNSYNISFKNITLSGNQSGKSSILGKDANNGHHNVTFENLKINSTKVNKNNYKDYFNTNSYVWDLNFK